MVEEQLGKSQEKRRPLKLSAVGLSLFQGSSILETADKANHTAGGSSTTSAVAVTLAAAPAAAPTTFMEELLAVKADDKKWTMFVMMASWLLTGVATCLALAAAALLTCCVYDAVSAWRHRARFRACQRQVKLVHEAFHSKRGDLPLCPYCVEHISCQRAPNKVVFLCGHRFHVECSNKWFQENPDVPTQCPICVDYVSGAPPTNNSCCNSNANAYEKESADGALAFMLQNLRRRYPEIISEECAKRWISCHTEIWLSELVCPRYKSILRKHQK
jgi:hypothetical protein